ncbi:hypothetical protein [Isobaculum melis]|uniref:Competence protein ComGE n=1 Tax=Isobaculum melis TaxID=142588 RepID=A0A1H9TWR1_9LACT|nr:hypothetical protein [Isobaculum melis]SES01438.1 hypothetical protein SAMN04488559_11727 [Isobaculum melis]
MKKNRFKKGYLLLEAIYGFTLLVTAISFYLPILLDLVTKNEVARHQTQLSRKVYEQVQQMVLFEGEQHQQFVIDQKEYECSLVEVGGLTGVQITNEAAFSYVPIKFE